MVELIPRSTGVELQLIDQVHTDLVLAKKKT